MEQLSAKLERLRRLVRARHAQAIARIAGMDALTTEERALLASIAAEDLDYGPTSIVGDSYRYGQLLQSSPEQANVAFASAEPLMLSPAEEAAVDIARERVAQTLRGFSATAENMVARGVLNAASRVRAEIAAGIADRASVANVAADLRRATGDLVRDWDRVAASELHSARQAGYADNVRRFHGDDAEVFKRPMPGACQRCIELHIGPDGHPRIFKLSELEAAGLDNSGRKRSEWEAVVGVTHPYCSCELVHMPTGWGFDAEGHIVPSGKGGVRKSLAPQLVNSHLEDRAVATGTSGPNIAWGTPVVPAPVKVDDGMRATIVAQAQALTEPPMLKREPSTYNFRGFDKPPIHPVSELQPAADALINEEDADEAAEHKAAVQRRVDRRADSAELTPKVEPRQPRLTMKERP